jgi:thiamine-phosphate pyrophosphorylase
LERQTSGKGRPFPTKGLYGFITEEFCRGRSLRETAEALGRGGVKIIQYREKDKSKKLMLRECKELREITARYGQCFIVNDHIDLALLCGADGVHLGQEDLPPREARSLLREGMILGVSTHSPDQLSRALEEGADYVGVGPIFPTNTKKDVCAAVGLEYLDYALRHSTVPCVAIGGIKGFHLETLLDRGARIIAMVTEILQAEDPGSTAKELADCIAMRHT